MEERVYFIDVIEQYPDSYIGLKNTQLEENGDFSGIVVKVGKTFEEVAEIMKTFQTKSNATVIEGYNLLNVERIGGIIFDKH
jgi:hypothetical protein